MCGKGCDPTVLQPQCIENATPLVPESNSNENPAPTKVGSGCKSTCCSSKPLSILEDALVPESISNEIPDPPKVEGGRKATCCISMPLPVLEKVPVLESKTNENLDLPKLESGCMSECCSSNSSSVLEKTAVPESDKIDSPKAKRGCKSTCCSSKPLSDLERVIPKTPSCRQDDFNLKRILLNVQGMTCTGCENRLKRALTSITGVTNVYVTFLNCRAEFDLDVTLISIEQVLLESRKQSGFGLTEVRTDLQTVTVYLNKSRLHGFGVTEVLGLVKVQPRNNTVADLIYDPDIVGIRDLLTTFPGGRLTLVPTYSTDERRQSKGPLKWLAIKTFLAALCTVPVAVLTLGQTKASGTKHGAIAAFVLATVVQLIATTEFYYNAFTALIHECIVELDMLIVISVTAAYVYSVVAFGFFMADRPLAIKESFATSTLLITLVLLGRFIATLARLKAVDAVSVRSLQDSKATLLGETGELVELDAKLLQFGDCFAVQPYSRVPTDGVVVLGCSEVDESMLTGESMPVLKKVDDHLTAGTINGSSMLTVKLTRLPGRNTITDIAELVEKANNTKPRVQDLADRVASWFIPVIMIAAATTFVIWLIVELCVRHHSASVAFSNSITYLIAVLAVSCPCAIGLAVPIVFVISSGIAARAGVIIKTAQATERAWQVTDVVFDKTGTLTLPELQVTDDHIIRGNGDLARSIARGLVAGIQHPVSASLDRHLYSCTIPPAKIQGISVIPGCGITGTFDGLPVFAGNPAWLGHSAHPIVEKLVSSNKTVLCITKDTELIAIYGLLTTIRPEAPSLIHSLHARGITVHLISGDSASAVHTCATTLGIPASNVRSRCSPIEKQSYVRSLTSRSDLESQTRSATKRKILFAGDGTNDALALAAADIGLQIGTTSELLGSSASVVLLGPLTGILTLLDLSRAAYRRIVFNFVWSAVYNVAAVLLAAGVAVEWRIPARWAGLGELVSVLPVVAVGASLMVGRW